MSDEKKNDAYANVTTVKDVMAHRKRLKKEHDEKLTKKKGKSKKAPEPTPEPTIEHKTESVAVVE